MRVDFLNPMLFRKIYLRKVCGIGALCYMSPGIGANANQLSMSRLYSLGCKNSRIWFQDETYKNFRQRFDFHLLWHLYC
jgi:hypothetical protein